MPPSPVNSNLNQTQSPYFANRNFWPSATTNQSATTMNNQQHNVNQYTLNPQASPFQASHLSTAYPPTANYFNLTSISKNKTDAHNNIAKPMQRLNSETRSTSSEQSVSNGSNKKHKKEYSKLNELERSYFDTEDDIKHYERKRKRLVEDLKRIDSELRSCEVSLTTHKNKLRSIQVDIDREKKRLCEASKQSVERNSKTNGGSPVNITTPSTNHQPNQHSPSNCSINNLSLNSNSTNAKQTNAQSTINNVINNLLEKKREVDFNKYEFIFNIQEEINEPKLMDANACE